jgi:hypothetical protein
LRPMKNVASKLDLMAPHVDGYFCSLASHAELKREPFSNAGVENQILSPEAGQLTSAKPGWKRRSPLSARDRSITLIQHLPGDGRSVMGLCAQKKTARASRGNKRRKRSKFSGTNDPDHTFRWKEPYCERGNGGLTNGLRGLRRTQFVIIQRL